jgi:hypothetical protein
VQQPGGCDAVEAGHPDVHQDDVRVVQVDGGQHTTAVLGFADDHHLPGAGAVIRNQVGAIVGLLSLLYVAEPLLGFIPHVGTAVQEYGLGGLASGATATTGFAATTHLLAQAPAIAVLAGYALAVLLAGAVVLRHRDITA